MEKGKLEIIKTKKGEYVVNVVYPDGKKQTISDLRLKDNSLNGKQVDIIRDKGQIIKIIHEGKEIYSKEKKMDKSTQRQQKSYHREKNHTNSNLSKAPYNFIPLNERVVPAADVIPDFDRYHSERYTGYIEIEIKALTPLYIRDTLTQKEYEEKLKHEKDTEKIPYINPDFFSPGGLLRIPGSSLRGMIRTMVEIMSFGKFLFFEKDRKYHFRSFADKSLDLRRQYSNQMLGGDKQNGYYPKVKAGYLIKSGLKYMIIPSIDLEGFQFCRVEEKDAINSRVIKELMRVPYYRCPERAHKEEYQNSGKCPICSKDLEMRYKQNPNYKVGFIDVKFKHDPPKVHNHSVPLYYAKVIQIWKIDDEKAPPDALRGTLVLSNWIGGKKGTIGKHLHWVIGQKDESVKLEIPDEVIENYKNDKGRSKETDLLKRLEENPNKEIPCFFVMDKDNRIVSFGHTGLFRLVYNKSLKEFVPKDLLSDKITDIAEAIFGTVEQSDDENSIKTIASRIFFEDLFLKEGELMETSTPKILSSPKPTTFQHYLVQDGKFEIDKNKNIIGLKTYNDSTQLRGYKLYWHRSGDGWIEDNKENIEKHKSQYTRITPVKEGSVFKGRIRFENLSDVELGALLFALDLPEGLAHKLGMAKPLGLGSVRITPKLYISDRKKRYEDLFFEWDKVEERKDKDTFKKAFESYILKKLNSKEKSIWEIHRMKLLKRMLDFDGKPSDDKTEYLKLEEFRERKVLPTPDKV